MRRSLYVFVLLSLAGIAISLWGISGVSKAVSMIQDGHAVAQDGVIGKDWNQASRGVDAVSVGLKSLGIFESIEKVGLILAAVSATCAFGISWMITKKSARRAAATPR
jgi:hypothetical protein